MTTPLKEMAIPTKLMGVSFSLTLRKAITGEKTGMVAMITAEMEGVENFNP
jgi:hypothetical protein